MPQIKDVKFTDEDGNPVELSEDEKKSILAEAMGITVEQLKEIQDIEDGKPGDVVTIDDDGNEVGIDTSEIINIPDSDESDGEESNESGEESNESGDESDSDESADEEKSAKSKLSRFSITAADLE